MKEIFKNYIENSFDGQKQAVFKIKQFEINYKKHFPKDKNAKTLDIGVGRGEMLTCMKTWGYDYEGIDISPSTIKFCQSLELKCHITDDTISWLKNNPGKFSLITCLDVLEHIPRDQTIQFLTSIRLALKEDGKLILQVPNLQSPYGYLHHFNDFTHVSGFVEHSLAQVLITAGFTSFEFKGFEEIFKKGINSTIRRLLRWGYRKIIRFTRAINYNPNPKILDPVFYAIVKK